jgi:hypothetical protein
MVLKAIWEEIDRNPARLRPDAADLVNLYALRDLVGVAKPTSQARHDVTFNRDLAASEHRRIPRNEFED